jgi:hypothetical protein
MKPAICSPMLTCLLPLRVYRCAAPQDYHPKERVALITCRDKLGQLGGP